MIKLIIHAEKAGLFIKTFRNQIEKTVCDDNGWLIHFIQKLESDGNEPLFELVYIIEGLFLYLEFLL